MLQIHLYSQNTCKKEIRCALLLNGGSIFLYAVLCILAKYSIQCINCRQVGLVYFREIIILSIQCPNESIYNLFSQQSVQYLHP